MSIKYKLFLSFFLMTSLFLAGVVVRFFEIHRTRKVVDALKPAVAIGDTPHSKAVTRARELLGRIPLSKSDPRLAATVMALDIVTEFRQMGERAVGLAAASLMEEDLKGKYPAAVRRDMKRLLTLSEILGASKVAQLKAIPEIDRRLKGAFAKARIDVSVLIKVLKKVSPEVRIATSGLDLQQLSARVLKHRGVLKKSTGSLGKATKAFVDFRREAASVSEVLRKAELELLRKIVLGFGSSINSEVEKLREFLDDEVAGVKTAMVDTQAGGDSPVKILFEKLYEYQLRETAYSIALFVISFILAIILTILIYREIVQPMAIIRNGLNNLAMGGDKKRINLHLGNEMGQIIESYNRLVDNMTSDMKRLVECPSCRCMYEMGDCFCKRCGRKLRFDG